MGIYDEDSDSSVYRLPGLDYPDEEDYLVEGGGEREPPPPPETVDHSGLDSDPDSFDLGEGGEEEPPSREDPLAGWDDPTRWPGEEPKEVPRLPGLAPPEKASEAAQKPPAGGKEPSL